VRVVRAIRAATGPEFAIGIKINATDYQDAGKKGEEVLHEQVKCLVAAGVDFVEVSGGSLENPEVRRRARLSFCLPVSLPPAQTRAN
jgi:2,4-dienoyl-CoA reductase-like NADH-dependent reductase (Old Yellow Enzyme family)